MMLFVVHGIVFASTLAQIRQGGNRAPVTDCVERPLRGPAALSNPFLTIDFINIPHQNRRTRSDDARHRVAAKARRITIHRMTQPASINRTVAPDTGLPLRASG